MGKMVDHVAMAIVEHVLGGPHDSEEELLRDLENGIDVEDMTLLMPRDLARVAIAALKEPNRKMLRAACKSMSPAAREGLPRVGAKEKHKIRYQAMIDAALAEGVVSE